MSGSMFFRFGSWRLVELLVVAGLDLPLVGGGGRHHDVVARVARGELGFELFVAAVVADGTLMPVSFSKFAMRVVGEVVVPDVEVQHLLFGGGPLRRAVAGACFFLAATRR